MDTELMMIQMKQDFDELAKEHENAARNEHVWALGCSNPDWIPQYEEQAEQHRELAKMYRRMADKVLTLIEQFEED